jgi:putative ABC transport system substrate-binding protein
VSLSTPGFRTIQALPKDLPVPSGATLAYGKLAAAASEGEPMPDVRRRRFITLLGGAAVAWPLAARAQQPDKTPRVGYVRAGTSNNDPYREAFERGMRDLGYVEGRNIAFEFRYYGDDIGSIGSLISDLLRAKVDIIVAAGTPAVRAAQAATQTIPIVMIAADPLGSGLIAGLARPGGVTTGLALLSTELTTKRLELLKEVMPRAARIAILRHPGNPLHSVFIEEIQPTANSLGLTYRIFEANRSEDFERSFASMREWSADAVVVLDDAAFISYRAVMTESAARHRLPLVCGFKEMTQAGCLFSYSVSLKDMWYRSATYVDKILKGAKPSDLPVQQGTKFEWAINLRAANALGLDVPATLLARADEVIE